MTLTPDLPATRSHKPLSTSPTLLPEARSHLTPLDGIRGLAIILIFLHHFMWTHDVNGTVRNVLFRVTGSLWIGVDIFFVLSGFLITRILLSAKTQPHYFRNFYVRRALRIFPLYYGVLAVVLFVLPPADLSYLGIDDVRAHQTWLWLYGTNIRIAWHNTWSFGFLAHFWTLAVEEHFYLLWPAIVWMLRPRALLRFSVAVMLLVPLARTAMVWTHHGGPALYVFTPFRADALVLGGLLAVLWTNPESRRRVGQWAPWILGLSLLVIGVIVLRSYNFFEAEPQVQTIGYSAIDLAAAALIVLALNSPPASTLRRVSEHPFMTTLGKYGYGLYVFQIINWPLRLHNAWVQYLDAHNHQVEAAVVHLLIGSAVIFALAYASFHLYEKQFLRLKRFFA